MRVGILRSQARRLGKGFYGKVVLLVFNRFISLIDIALGHCGAVRVGHSAINTWGGILIMIGCHSHLPPGITLSLKEMLPLAELFHARTTLYRWHFRASFSPASSKIPNKQHTRHWPMHARNRRKVG